MQNDLNQEFQKQQYEKLKKEFSNLYKWIGECFLGKNMKAFLLFDSLCEHEITKSISFIFYTSQNEHHIKAHIPNKTYDGYLGCTLISRKKRPGENWDRGRNLFDGDYSEGTFNKIIKESLYSEMVLLDIQWPLGNKTKI